MAVAVVDVTAQQQQPEATAEPRAAAEEAAAAVRTRPLAATVGRARWVPATC